MTVTAILPGLLGIRFIFMLTIFTSLFLMFVFDDASYNIVHNEKNLGVFWSSSSLALGFWYFCVLYGYRGGLFNLWQNSSALLVLTLLI